MRPRDPIEKLIADLEIRPSAELDARVHRAIESAQRETNWNKSDSFLSGIRRIIMRTGTLKWAATAAVLVVIAVGLLTQSAPRAFAIERVIAAYNGVRFVHVKNFKAPDREPNEFWIQSGEQGQVTKARYYLPVTEDGIKLITWTPERSEIWFKSKGGFVTFQTKRIAPWMQSILEQSQPKLVMNRLLEDQKSGKVQIDVETPQDAKKPAIIIVNHKDIPAREVYLVDQKSDLVTRIDHYKIENGAATLESHQEFLDYNAVVDDKFFSLRDELPEGVRISDRLNQISGMPQGNLTDEQAAVEAVRQFCQALLDKDYKKAGLIVCGELEEYAKADFGGVNVTSIISVGPAEAQPDWEKRGYKVPCELEITEPNGNKKVWSTTAFVRPGDDEMHPDYWNITGGNIFGAARVSQAEVKVLPDNAKYEKMSVKEAAEAFFKACSEKNWDEASKFWPMPANDARTKHMKDHLGGLEIISIGEPFQTNGYAGWYVPYEVKLQPTEVNVRVSNANTAGRYVVTGFANSKQQVLEDLKWPQNPETLADNDKYQKMSPNEVVKRYFDAMAKSDWVEMRKFAPESDVTQTKRQISEAKAAGRDGLSQLPVVQPGEPVSSAAQSAFFVKCLVPGDRKFNLAMRNDNPAKRWVFDGGL